MRKPFLALRCTMRSRLQAIVALLLIGITQREEKMEWRG
jgi:hypothetical protein